jgi:hypothetical protein
MWPARAENLKLGKGSLLLDLYAGSPLAPTGALTLLGDANSLSTSAAITTVEKYSNTQASGARIARATTRQSYELKVALSEFAMDNLKLFLRATSNTKTQSTGTAKTKVLSNVVPGKYYEIGDRRVTAVVVTKTSPAVTDPLVAGVNYDLNSEFGQIFIRPDGGFSSLGTDDLLVTYDAPALSIEQARISKVGQSLARLVYIADDANVDGKGAHDRLEIWKVDVAPDGDLNLISDDYGSFSLTMAILSDAANHPNDEFGVLERI